MIFFLKLHAKKYTFINKSITLLIHFHAVNGQQGESNIQAPVVQSADNTIQWINRYPARKMYFNTIFYPLDSKIEGRSSQLLRNLSSCQKKAWKKKIQAFFSQLLKLRSDCEDLFSIWSLIVLDSGSHRSMPIFFRTVHGFPIHLLGKGLFFEGKTSAYRIGCWHRLFLYPLKCKSNHKLFFFKESEFVSLAWWNSALMAAILKLD